MCEFISWIEKKELVTGKPKLYFLTGKQVFETEKGKELQAWCKSKDDLVGHGAIRHFYGLEQDEGEIRECTDFSTPHNFPNAIVTAIKDGEMRGLGTPQGLLSKPLYDKYQADLKLLDDKYQADCKLLGDKYWDLFAIRENRSEAWR